MDTSKEELAAHRRRVLSELANEAQELGLYDLSPAEYDVKRLRKVRSARSADDAPTSESD